MRSILHRSTVHPCGTHSRIPSHDATRVSPPSPKVFLHLQAADMEYQVDGKSITPAGFEADSRWIRAVKAHRAAAAHQPITSTPPSSTPTQNSRPPNTTPGAPTLRRHAPLPQLSAEDFNIVFRPGGGLDLHTTTNGVVLQTLCSLANIGYSAARTADHVRIILYNYSLTVGTSSEPRARLYLRASELRLGTISYPLPEACINCWTPGHRVDVCIKPKSALCYRCGQTHERVEPPDLRPMLHPVQRRPRHGIPPMQTSFRQKWPVTRVQLQALRHQHHPPGSSSRAAGLFGPRHRSTSRGARSSSHHHSISFPPLSRNADHPPPTPSPHTSVTSFVKQPVSWSRSNSASCPASHDLKSV
ncbi:hypothetical protein MRX96_037278 [Rhipicephalus microplus]